MSKQFYKFRKEDAERFIAEGRYYTQNRGNEIQFRRCPYCGGGGGRDEWTFAINTETGQFNCKRASCDRHGNMITLSKDFGFSLGREIDEYYSPKPKYKTLKNVKPEPKTGAIEYLASRGISQAVAEKYRITVTDSRPDVLVIPFYDESDTLQLVKYRNTKYVKGETKGPKEWSEAQCKPILFGMNRANHENKTLIITEGELDQLSITEAGIENAVSVPTGANGFTWIPYCWDFMCKFDTLIVFGDYEKGKITLLDAMQSRFNGVVKHVREEDYKDCKDANDILRKYGPEAVRACVENAVPVRNPRIKCMSEVQRVDMSEMEIISTGFRQLDRALGGFYFGQLILLTGERGLGKSTMASQFAIQAADQGAPAFLYSGELVEWMVRDGTDRQLAGAKNITTTTSNLGFEQYTVWTSTRDRIDAWYDGKMYLYDNRILGGEIEEEALPKTIENAIKQYGCRFLVIDNLMTAMSDDLRSDLYRQQTAFVRKLAEMAKLYDVIILLIAHPRKSNGTNFGNDDIAGSSNITNLADVVLNFTRPQLEYDAPPPGDNERVIQIHKNRLSGRICKEGYNLYYEPSSKRLSENPNDYGWLYGWADPGKTGFVPAEGEDGTHFD